MAFYTLAHQYAPLFDVLNVLFSTDGHGLVAGYVGSTQNIVRGVGAQVAGIYPGIGRR